MSGESQLGGEMKRNLEVEEPVVAIHHFPVDSPFCLDLNGERNAGENLVYK